MAKEFRTIDELVALLESRGVSTDGETTQPIEGYLGMETLQGVYEGMGLVSGPTTGE